MQLTPFDRWLRKKFVYETHIHTLRPAESIPKGIRAINLPEQPGRRYKHLYIARNCKVADRLIYQLKESGQMYTTQIVDRKAWFVPLIAPKNKSLTWWLVSTITISISVVYVLLYVKSFMDDPAFRKNFLDALQLLKG